MWGPLCLMWMLTWSALGAPSPQSTPCPEGCECSTAKKVGISARCSSQNFLYEYTSKQLQDITDIRLSGLSINTVDDIMRKMRNLNRLDLSNNRIENLDSFPLFHDLTYLDLSGNRLDKLIPEHLPKSIEHLDISSNRIRVLSKDVMKYLPNLRELNFNGNPLTCDCDFVRDRDYFLHKDVHIVRPANCYNPENVRGISWFSVHCVSGRVTYDDLGEMLGDEPGSGEDVANMVATSSSSDIMGYDTGEEDLKGNEDIEEEYFRHYGNSSSSESIEDSVEGSGSAYFNVGSGDGEYTPVSSDPQMSSCFFDCSTPPPSNETDETEPPASIGEEISKFFGDIRGETTTASTTTATTTTTTQIPVFEKEVEKSAATLSTGARANIEAPKESQATQEVSKKNNTTTYIVVGALFVAMVALVAYVVVKKRKARNNNNRRPIPNHEAKEPAPVEMKPLMMTESVPFKPSPPAERTPLINGQNGTKKPEEDQTDAKVDIPVENGLEEEETPEIRPKKDDDALLTPGTKRVTIQARELSSPKSPVLVHRHVGDDGKIVSSPLPNEFKYT